jgi:hypothetical protein
MTRRTPGIPAALRWSMPLLIGLLVLPAAPAAGDGWEHWSRLQLSAPVREGLDLKTNGSIRLDEDGAHHYYTHLEVGIDWKVRSHLVLGAYYRHINKRAGESWSVEYRPHVNATLNWQAGKLAMTDRNRLERRAKDGVVTYVYRNMLTLSVGGFTPANVRPYVAAEPFWNLSEGEFDRNRLYAGARAKVWGPLEADLYYMRESTKKGEQWSDTDVVATEFNYRF